MKEILKIINRTIYQFFDVCEDDEEVPLSDKDKLLLEVNKAICNNLRTLEQETVLDKIRAEIEQVAFKDVNGSKYIFVSRVNQIINKYKTESEDKK